MNLFCDYRIRTDNKNKDYFIDDKIIIAVTQDPEEEDAEIGEEGLEVLSTIRISYDAVIQIQISK